MGLTEFLRQWQGSRLAAGIALSVLLHLMVVAAIVWGPPPFQKPEVKRGEPLIVELPNGPDSPPPGRPSAPAPPAPAARVARPPAPVTPPRPVVAARPTPTPPAPRPVIAARPAPPPPAPSVTPPAPERPADPLPVAKAPEAEAPPVPAPPAVEQAPSPPTTAETAQPAAPPAAPLVAAVPPAPSARPVPDIRSLRRGGAGGSGDGRAGIEGEPIALDSTDPRYSDYLDQIRRRIKEKWGYPCVKNHSTRECEYKTAQLIIEFGIAKDGKVPFINIVRSSGYPIYDDYAVNAVKLADFPPIPDSFSKKGVPIQATFSYVVQSSLTNILR